MITKLNNMATFFSGTDNEELQENAPNHNCYLSLIVNNRMEMCARLAIKGSIKSENVSFEFTDPDGNQFTVPQETESKEVVFYHDCNITKPSMFFGDEDFAKRVEAICAVPIISKSVITSFPALNKVNKVNEIREANDLDKVENFIITHFSGKVGDTLDSVLQKFKYRPNFSPIQLVNTAKKKFKLKTDADEVEFIGNILEVVEPYEYDNLEEFKNKCYMFIEADVYSYPVGTNNYNFSDYYGY